MTNEELSILIRQGNREYIPLLYTQIEKLLKAKARSFYNKYPIICSRCGIALDDLIQEGYFAMLDAVNYYKPEDGYKFLTYIGYPLKSRYNRLTGNRSSRTKNEPLNNTKSLDEPLGAEDGAFTIGDVIKDENSEALFDEILGNDYLEDLHNTIEKSMESLTPTQRTVIQCKYFKNMTLSETSNEIDCSTDKARQYEVEALRKLRYSKNSIHLRSFL